MLNNDIKIFVARPVNFVRKHKNLCIAAAGVAAGITFQTWRDGNGVESFERFTTFLDEQEMNDTYDIWYTNKYETV